MFVFRKVMTSNPTHTPKRHDDISRSKNRYVTLHLSHETAKQRRNNFFTLSHDTHFIPDIIVVASRHVSFKRSQGLTFFTISKQVFSMIIINAIIND